MDKENKKIQDEIEKVLTNASVIGVGHLANQIDKEKRGLVDQTRQMKKAKEEIAKLEEEFKALQQGQRNDKIQSEIRQILTLPIKEAKAVGEKTLLFETEELHNKSDKQLIGKFKIIFDFNEGAIPVRAYNYTQRVRDTYDSPHISNGSVCWGGIISPQIAGLIRNRDFFYLMEVTIDLIVTCEKGHPYIPYKDWLEDALPVDSSWEHPEVFRLLNPDQMVVEDAAVESMRSDRAMLDRIVREARRSSHNTVDILRGLIGSWERGMESLSEMQEKLGKALYALTEQSSHGGWYVRSPDAQDEDYYIWKTIFRPSKDGKPVVMSTAFLNNAIKEYKQYRLYIEHTKEIRGQINTVNLEAFRLMEGDRTAMMEIQEIISRGPDGRHFTHREADVLMKMFSEGRLQYEEQRRSPYWMESTASTTGSMRMDYTSIATGGTYITTSAIPSGPSNYMGHSHITTSAIPSGPSNYMGHSHITTSAIPSGPSNYMGHSHVVYDEAAMVPDNATTTMAERLSAVQRDALMNPTTFAREYLSDVPDEGESN